MTSSVQFKPKGFPSPVTQPSLRILSSKILRLFCLTPTERQKWTNSSNEGEKEKGKEMMEKCDEIGFKEFCRDKVRKDKVHGSDKDEGKWGWARCALQNSHQLSECIRRCKRGPLYIFQVSCSTQRSDLNYSWGALGWLVVPRWHRQQWAQRGQHRTSAPPAPEPGPASPAAPLCILAFYHVKRTDLISWTLGVYVSPESCGNNGRALQMKAI